MNEQLRKEKSERLAIQNSSYRLFVGNLGSRMTEGELRATVERFGEVTSIHLVKDALTGNSDGYAFVEMATGDGANRAVAALNGKGINGHFLVARCLF